LATKPRPPLGEKSVRIIGFLVFVAGLLLSFGSSYLFNAATSREIARFTVYQGGAFQPADIDLGPSQAPLGIRVELAEGGQGQYVPDLGAAAFTIIATHEGRTTFTNAVSFSEDDRTSAPATGLTTYAKNIGQIAELSNGKYKFIVGEGDADGIALQTIELVLLANDFTEMPDVSTLGTILIWLGAALFFIGLRRRNRVAVDAPPEPSKWGRGS
jgi:hypothetical protein